MMKKVASIFCIVSIVLIAMTQVAAADELGTGAGDGSGGGSDIAFALVQTEPQDGATDVNVNESIWLLFNKNVVNMAVQDINKANIVLRDSDGHKVSAEVTMKDDQVEPEYRREIVVVPTNPLDPGSTYILTIGSAMQAKNGDTLGTTYTVTTAGEKPDEQTDEQQSNATTPTEDQSVDSTQDDASSGQDGNVETLPTETDLEEGSLETDNDAKKAHGITLLVAGIAVLGGAVVATVIMRKRGKKSNF